MAARRRLRWVAEVSGEGGPVMLADLPDYAQWTGATPYEELRELDPRFALATKDKMSTLHYWGQFTDKLPEPFKAEGGHHYLSFATEARAREELTELCRVVTEKLPSVEITEEGGEVLFVLPNAVEGDEETMHAELAPRSEYDASWQEHEEDELWVHEFGKSGRALFWDMGGAGVTEVGVSEDGTEIVLMRAWVDEDEDVEHARAHVDVKREDEVAAGEIDVTSGHAVVMWAPVAPFQLAGMKSPDDLARLAKAARPPQLSMDAMEGVGTALPMKAGRWVVSLGTTEEEDDDDEDEHDYDLESDVDHEDHDHDEGEDEDEDEDDDTDREVGEASWTVRWCRLTWVG